MTLHSMSRLQIFGNIIFVLVLLFWILSFLPGHGFNSLYGIILSLLGLTQFFVNMLIFAKLHDRSLKISISIIVGLLSAIFPVLYSIYIYMMTEQIL